MQADFELLLVPSGPRSLTRTFSMPSRWDLHVETSVSKQSKRGVYRLRIPLSLTNNSRILLAFSRTGIRAVFWSLGVFRRPSPGTAWRLTSWGLVWILPLASSVARAFVCRGGAAMVLFCRVGLNKTSNICKRLRPAHFVRVLLGS